MADLKTKRTEASVETFLNAVSDAKQRDDAFRLLEIMREVTGEAPRMWGPTMVGFGDYHYVYASGHEGDTFRTGFSPRKGALALYGLLSNERSKSLLKKMGKVKAGKGCLYIKRLEEIDLAVLREMIHAAMALASAACPKRKSPAAKKPRKKA